MSDLPAPQRKLPPALAQFRDIGPKELLAAFLNRTNENTRRGYERDLNVLANFLEAGSVEEAVEILVTSPHGQANALALAFQAHLSREGFAGSTINRRLSAMRSVIKLANTLGVVPWKLQISNVPSLAMKDTSGPGTEGFRAMLDWLAAQPDTSKTRRDRAMLHLLFGLALRRFEVTGLDMGDVDFRNNKLAVRGKGMGGEATLMTMPVSVIESLQSWCGLRGYDPGPLFISLDPAGKGSGRLTGGGLWRIVRKAGEGAGLKVWPHALRHAGVTAALDATDGDVRAVQRFSRHKQLDTVILYDDNRKDLAGQVANKVADALGREQEPPGGSL